jgi:hypothetical protein
MLSIIRNILFAWQIKSTEEQLIGKLCYQVYILLIMDVVCLADADGSEDDAAQSQDVEEYDPNHSEDQPGQNEAAIFLVGSSGKLWMHISNIFAAKLKYFRRFIPNIPTGNYLCKLF